MTSSLPQEAIELPARLFLHTPWGCKPKASQYWKALLTPSQSKPFLAGPRQRFM